jgi:hypothetical protein
VQSKLALSVVVADPNCIEALVKQEVLVNRNSVQFMVRPMEDRTANRGYSYRVFELSLGLRQAFLPFFLAPHSPTAGETQG